MKVYSISESEWKIMNVLWEQPDLELSDIVENLKDNEWSYSTIKTLLKRLVDKGVVIADKTSGRNFKYKPAVEEQECKIKEAKSFLAKVFDSSLSMFVSTLVKESNLSQKDEDELMKIINKMEDGD
ncbi:CopY/TcrY family copper transport repressor [Clostridium sp. CTA-5]